MQTNKISYKRSIVHWITRCFQNRISKLERTARPVESPLFPVSSAWLGCVQNTALFQMSTNALRNADIPRHGPLPPRYFLRREAAYRLPFRQFLRHNSDRYRRASFFLPFTPSEPALWIRTINGNQCSPLICVVVGPYRMNGVSGEIRPEYETTRERSVLRISFNNFSILNGVIYLIQGKRVRFRFLYRMIAYPDSIISNCINDTADFHSFIPHR
jgi:hypothetical protein